MEKYDIVIVLCASSLNKEGLFDEISSDGSYLGGQIRMQSAVDINSEVTKFIAVGGGIEKNDNLEKWKRVNDMRDFLVQNGVDKNKIIRILSEKNTCENFRAIYRCFQKLFESVDKTHQEKIIKSLLNKRVGILTNFYHMPRALRLAEDNFKYIFTNFETPAFIPIVAEAVIKDSQFPQLSYSKYQTEFLQQIFKEIKGLEAWENEEYTGQKKLPQKWIGECHGDDFKQWQSLLN